MITRRMKEEKEKAGQACSFSARRHAGLATERDAALCVFMHMLGNYNKCWGYYREHI